MKKEVPNLETTIQVRDWLMENYAPETSRRTLVLINAAFRWAVESDMTIKNPFEGLQRQIKKKKAGDTAWAAFTTTERDRIIAAFEHDHPFYAPWVKFLFWTGARPEEAAGLQWLHVAMDYSEIFFRQAWPADMPTIQPTKNGKTTRFPCNNRLRGLLAEMYPGPSKHRDGLVFNARTGGRFHYTNFQTRYWRPTVQALVQRGEVACYLTQYHCRHTFITESLNHLSVADVSYLCRVSTQVLYQHYAGRSRNIDIPEF